jgi:transposase
MLGGSVMTQEIVSNELWEIVEQLLPEPVNPRGGRPRVPARAALTGIIYVLKSAIPWRMLPEEFGCSGSPAGVDSETGRRRVSGDNYCRRYVTAWEAKVTPTCRELASTLSFRPRILYFLPMKPLKSPMAPSRLSDPMNDRT